MSIGWWRTRVFVLYFASRLSAFHMSSTSLPGNDHDICDSPKASNIKKVKLDQHVSPGEKDILRTNVPSTAFLAKPVLTQKFDVPASAVKVGTSSSTIESFDMDSEGQSCQTQNKDSPMLESNEPQETQNKDEEKNDSQIETQESTLLASLPDCIKAGDAGESRSGDEATVVDATTVATESDARALDESCSSNDDIHVDAMDSQEEGDIQSKTHNEDSSSCDVWEQLPCFASEMDQSDEVDGNNCSAKEKVTKVDQAAARNSEGEHVSEKKRWKKRNKKQVDKETKPKKPPPNAFVAVRIPSPDINAKFEEVQRALAEKDKRLQQVFVPAAKNHITLMVMSLNNQEDIEKAKLALFEATEKVKSELDLLNDPLELNFSGLGNFSKNVLFAKVAEGPGRERLIAMAGIVESVFVSKELVSSSARNFTPHLTIAKMSKMPRGWTQRGHKKHHEKRKGKKSGSYADKKELRGIDHSSYAELLDMEFGRQTIEGLELLSMEHPPTEDGYYHCYQRYSFATTSEDES